MNAAESWKLEASGLPYDISSYGRVRSLRDGRMMKPWIAMGGYPYVCLCLHPIREKHAIHRLVLHAFVGPPPADTECRHLDGNPANNHLENLRWGTSVENKLDIVRHHGRWINAHFTPDQAAAIRREHAGVYGDGRRLAQKYGVSEYVISQLRRGRTYPSKST